MIRYDLVCDQGHSFDSWFRDSSTYDSQAERGLVACPVCDSHKVSKQLMAPGIPAKSNKKSEEPARVFTGPVDPRQQMLIKMMRELRKHVEKNADYVGDQFAEEARRIHYKETEQRGIYGEATREDAEALVEEGIEIHPLPLLPEEGN
ncbi:MAG: DUF1178 family protein [Rhizobiales bacterium]|nr:DUF1178 family protein [Hyphomicrobiales bacterium]